MNVTLKFEFEQLTFDVFPCSLCQVWTWTYGLLEQVVWGPKAMEYYKSEFWVAIFLMTGEKKIFTRWYHFVKKAPSFTYLEGLLFWWFVSPPNIDDLWLHNMALIDNFIHWWLQWCFLTGRLSAPRVVGSLYRLLHCRPWHCLFSIKISNISYTIIHYYYASFIVIIKTLNKNGLLNCIASSIVTHCFFSIQLKHHFIFFMSCDL